MKMLTAFPRTIEFEKMQSALVSLGIPHEVIDPSPGFSRVGCPAIALEQESRAALASAGNGDFISSGWVDYHSSAINIPANNPPSFSEDVFGTSSIMIIAPCIADEKKIRLIAHTSNDMSSSFPYLNSIMKDGSYNHETKTFSFMDSYRMVTLYSHRISIAKSDDIVDGWRMLEKIRCKVNDAYAHRASIEPSYEMRKKPPALEIYKRLPGTNCGKCGQKTCMAFAMSLWSGNGSPSDCMPIFSPEFSHLKDAFLEICAGLGMYVNERENTKFFSHIR
jgi:ArsR family metal-binding transcriptional regulator